MKTYQAGKDPVEAWNGETRGWVFELLENPEYRKRLESLAALDLTRRAGCEPCLRALVADECSYESVLHLSRCRSCRKASFALGMDGAGKAAVGSPRRRRALWLGLAAAAVVAVPVLGSQLVLSDDGGTTNSGGMTSTVPQVDPVPRAKPAGAIAAQGSSGGSGHSALPETT